jgi:hypothetical protein
MGIVGSSAVNHTKAQMHELSHGRADGAHLGFATRDESLIDRFDVRCAAWPQLQA